MIEPQTVDPPFRSERENVCMRPLEDGGKLHPYGGEIVDVEEATVIDLLARDAPIAEAKTLLAEECVEPIEGRWVSLPSVVRKDGIVEGTGDVFASRRERGEAAFDDLFLPRALQSPLGCGLPPLRKVSCSRDDAEQLDYVHVLRLS